MQTQEGAGRRRGEEGARMVRKWEARATEIGAVDAGNGQKVTKIVERREGARVRGRCGAGAAARQKESREVQLERSSARPRAALQTATETMDGEGMCRMWRTSLRRRGVDHRASKGAQR